MNDSRAGFVIFLLGDPEALEGTKGGKDRATNPDRVLALKRSGDLDL